MEQVRSIPACGRIWKTIPEKPISQTRNKGLNLGWKRRSEDRLKMAVWKDTVAEIKKEKQELIEVLYLMVFVPFLMAILTLLNSNRGRSWKLNIANRGN